MKTFASRLFPALAVSSLLTAATGAAIAGSPNSPKLKGTFAETGETVCLISNTVRGVPGGTPVPITPSGFNPATLSPNPGAFSTLFLGSAQGVRTFDGEGSGTHRGRNVSINSSPNIFPNAFTTSASVTDIVGTFTYEVAPDGTISVEDDTLGSIVSGPRAGQTTTNHFVLTGRASNNAHSLILAADTPEIETLTFSNGDVQQRLCQRSRTLIRTDD
jgi:hypothetical protein